MSRSHHGGLHPLLHELLHPSSDVVSAGVRHLQSQLVGSRLCVGRRLKTKQSCSK